MQGKKSSTSKGGRKKGAAQVGTSQLREIAVMRSQGKSIEEIGEATGVSPATVHRRLHDPEVIALMERLGAAHEELLARGYKAALLSAEEDLTAEDWQARADARKSILRAIWAYDQARGAVKAQQNQNQGGGEVGGGGFRLSELLIVLRQAQGGGAANV